jgi:hypothetical protein
MYPGKKKEPTKTYYDFFSFNYFCFYFERSTTLVGVPVVPIFAYSKKVQCVPVSKLRILFEEVTCNEHPFHFVNLSYTLSFYVLFGYTRIYVNPRVLKFD